MRDFTLSQLQSAISKIDGVTLGDGKLSDRYFMKLVEEVGELAECIRKDKRMTGDNIKDTVEEELYDVFYYVLCLANVYGIDLQKAMELKEKRNAQRYQRISICEESIE